MEAGLRKAADIVAGNGRTPQTGGAGLFRRFGFLATVGLSAIIVSFAIHGASFESGLDFPVNVGPDLTGAIDAFISWLVVNLGWLFDAISDNLKIALGKLRDLLVWIPWPVMVALVFVTGWRVASFASELLPRWA